MKKLYEIRKIYTHEVKERLALALKVFLQFEASDYKPEGIDTFNDVRVKSPYLKNFLLYCIKIR